MVWKRAGPLNTLAALRVSGISPSRPNGLVQSKPDLAPVRRPCSEGSMVMPGMPVQDHEVLVGLEARAERPLDLQVVADVDVLVEHEDVLEPHDAAEQRGDREPRFAEAALPDRDAQRVGAARVCRK